jgi:2-dehydropantoate 2-reductase
VSPSPRILVVGAGGLGGVVAATLADAGVPVELAIRRPEVARLVRERGLVLCDRRGPRTVKDRLAVHQGLPASGPYDFVLLATPPDDAPAAATAAVPLLAPAGRLVMLPNGLPEDRLAPAVGADRLIGAVVAFGASSPEPGVAVRTSAGGFTLGRPGGAADGPVQALAAVLGRVFPVRLTANLAGVRWSKLAINCAVSSLGTAGGTRVGPLLRRAFVRRLALEAIGEAVAVAVAEGVTLEKVGGTVDLRWLALPARPGPLALLARHAVLLAVGFRYRRLRSSMLAQLERGGVPPVDALNGEVAVRARRHGWAAPVNEALVTTIHALALGEARPGVAMLAGLYRRTRGPGRDRAG